MVTRPMLDVTHLIGDLWIGALPPSAKGYEKFDVIYFVAEEHPPPAGTFSKQQTRFFGFQDGPLTLSMLSTALEAADMVTRDLVEGHRTLVTCAMGRNRSAFVCALALHMLTAERGVETGRYVQEKRRDRLGIQALTNESFRAYLEKLV
jgi:protein-tyrosine phosphatase